MVRASNDQFDILQAIADQCERLDHGFQALICSPLTECKHALDRVSTPLEIRVFGSSGEDPVTAHIHRTASIFVADQAAVGWE